MDPELLARIQAVLSALNDTRQRAQSGLVNVAQNVARGVTEGVALPHIPEGFRLNPMRPEMSPQIRQALNAVPTMTPEPAMPMPLTQTLAMMGGMFLMPGPEGTKYGGSFDSPEAFRKTVEALDDDALGVLYEASRNRGDDLAHRFSANNPLSEGQQRALNESYESPDFTTPLEQHMHRVEAYEVEREMWRRGLAGNTSGAITKFLKEWDSFEEGPMSMAERQEQLSIVEEALNSHYNRLREFRGGLPPNALGFADNPRGARRGSPRPDGPMQPTQMESGPVGGSGIYQVGVDSKSREGAIIHTFETPKGPIDVVVIPNRDGSNIEVDWFGSMGGYNQPDLGYSGSRHIVDEVLSQYPDAKTISFERISGTRGRNTLDSVNERHNIPGRALAPDEESISTNLGDILERGVSDLDKIVLPTWYHNAQRLPPRPAWLDAIIEEMLLDPPKGPTIFDRIVSQMGKLGDPTAGYNTDDPAQAMKMIMNEVILPGAFNSGMSYGRRMGRNDDSSSER